MAGRSACNVASACGAAFRKRRRNIVVAVYEVTDRKRRHRGGGSSFGTPISVCRGTLTSACNPGVCDCPDMTCKVRRKKTQLLWLLIKLTVFGYAVEEVYRFGVWSDAEQTEALTDRYMAFAEEFFSTRNKTVRTPEEIYDMRRIQYNLKNAWNNSIMLISDSMSSIPRLLNSLGDNVRESLFEKKPDCEQ